MRDGGLTMRWLWVATAVSAQLGLVGVARGDELRNLVEQVLDQPVERLLITDRPLLEAFAALEEETGVRVRVTPQAVEKMPYGDRTQVTLRIEDLTLRTGLTRLLAGLGLTFAVIDDAVVVRPAPVLARKADRLTLAEIRLLTALRDTAPEAVLERFPIRWPSAVAERDVVLGDLKGRLAAEPAENGLTALEQATRALGLRWRVAGEAIELMTAAESVRARLARTLPMDYHAVPLDELLVDLGRRVGVTMHFAPGALNDVDARDRVADVIQRDVSVLQTLERIAGNTGLAYEIDGEGVHFSGPPREETLGANANARFIRIDLPVAGSDATVAYIIREEDLPPVLRASLEAELAEALERMAAEAARVGER